MNALATTWAEPETVKDCQGAAAHGINERTNEGGASFVNSFLSYAVTPPTLEESALHGLAGVIVRKIEPHTETHPAALLIQLLIGAGNLIGRNPFFVTERDRQHANLFGVIVGESARGRKGTSWGHVRHFLAEVDSHWEESRVLGGIASGEGVISELKDEEEPSDRRLLLMEGEFAQVLRVLQREGNTASVILRNAWDSGNLRNLANSNRNKKGESLRATGCHISMIGHITRTELSKLLTANDSANGFANRILWVHSSRARLLPDGGDIQSVDFAEEIELLREAVRLARTRSEMKRSAEARDYWHAIYPLLTADVPGRWGQATSRGEAQVVRIALLFSLLDGGSEIALSHLKAAESVWKYCSESARWAFEDSRFSAHAERILACLESGPLSRTEISEIAFKNNVPRTEIDAAFGEIESLIEQEQRSTNGRTATVYSLRAKDAGEKTNTDL